MNNQSTRKYKRYDEGFKRSTVEHWMVSGKSARQIAGELGINEQSLKVWKQNCFLFYLLCALIAP